MSSFEVYGPGELPDVLNPGDVFLAHGPHLISKLIRLATNSKYNHAGVLMDGDGGTAEALGSGIVRSRIGGMRDRTLAVIDPGYAPGDRERALEHAEWVVGQGWSYSYATFFGMLLYWLTGGRLMVSSGAKASICSAFAAEVMQVGGIKFPEKHPLFHTPADLAERFLLED